MVGLRVMVDTPFFDEASPINSKPEDVASAVLHAWSTGHAAVAKSI